LQCGDCGEKNKHKKTNKMPVTIRLSRHGKKHQAFYHIVVADSRAPRDGRLIEKIGIYNPRTNPATIEINQEKALSWLNKGAQPSDTCRAILSYKGVLYKRHLNEGVKKGAMTQEQADAKFAEWMEQKSLKISQKQQSVMNAGKEAVKSRLADEAKVREKIRERLAAKRIAESEAAAAAAVEAAHQAEGGEASADPAEPAAE
jgi:small subunit ribosomal protein S16